MKIRYKILSLSLVFTALLGLGSCSEDFLETTPTDSVSTEIAMGNVDNMMLAINGIHRALYGQNGFIDYHAGQQYMIPMTEFGASDAMHSKSANRWFMYFLQWDRHTNAQAEDMEFAWFIYYHIIGSANNIINNSAALRESDDLHNILGQAYAYRAWAHFNLVRYFAKAYMIGDPSTDLGVPIMLGTEPPYEGLERSTVQAVYDQIKADLTTSMAHFEKASGRIDLSHLDMSVAKGIAARVYLTIGDWTNASKFAGEAREGYTLMDEEEYKSGFNSVDNPEWMWGSRVIQDQTTYYRSYFYFCCNNFNGSQNRGNPKFMNHSLYAQIEDGDYRKDQILVDAPSTFDEWNEGANEGRYADEDEYNAAVKEYRGIVNNSSRHNMVPYMHIKLLQADGPTITPMDVLHMRAAEMYLIEAEAEARLGNDGPAQTVLGELLKERYRDANYEVAETGQALIDEILLQRRIELFIEGHRWFDMLRNDEVLDRAGSGADPDLYLKGYYQDRPSENPKWLFLIPQREINANSKIVQNKH